MHEWTNAGGDASELHPTHCLRIVAPVVKPLFISREELEKRMSVRARKYGTSALPSGNGPFMVLESQANLFTIFRVRLDLESCALESLSDAIAVLLQPGSMESPRTYAVMLIVKPHGDRHQRVGITDWNNEWSWERVRESKEWEPTHKRQNLPRCFEKQTIYVE